jgi:hypothetical protein
MEQITDIGLPAAIICLGVYFIILFFQYIARKVWAATPNKIVRGVIKWVGTMWLPLWPIIIGTMLVRYVPSIPIPKLITDLSPERGITWSIYGAFCGMISMAVVKAIKQLLEKKGINLEISDLKEAKLAVKNGNDKKEAPKEDKVENEPNKEGEIIEASESDSEAGEDEDEKDEKDEPGESGKD